MSSNSSGRVPKLRLHKPSGRAVVRLDGRDIYLGKYGTEDSRVAYQRTIGEWLQLGRQAPPVAGSKPGEITIGGLMVAYLEFARGCYRKNGQQTSEYDGIRYSLRPLRLYESTQVNELGPLAL